MTIPHISAHVPTEQYMQLYEIVSTLCRLFWNLISPLMSSINYISQHIIQHQKVHKMRCIEYFVTDEE